MRNQLGNSMVGGEKRQVKHLIEQKTVAAIAHSLHPSHPHLLSRVFLRLHFLPVSWRNTVCTSPITDSLNYSLFALQLGGFVLCFGFGFFLPLFLPCKLTSYQPAVKIASGIHQMQVFCLKSWSPAGIEPISRSQALLWQMASLSVKG